MNAIILKKNTNECNYRGSMMKITLEKVWDEYFAELCSVIDSEDERELIKKAAVMHEALNKLLIKDQSEVLEKYVETLYEIQGLVVKKAFLRGCDFVTNVLFGTRS